MNGHPVPENDVASPCELVGPSALPDISFGSTSDQVPLVPSSLWIALLASLALPMTAVIESRKRHGGTSGLPRTAANQLWKFTTLDWIINDSVPV